MANFNQSTPRFTPSSGAPLNRSRSMTRNSALIVLVLLLALPMFVIAQTPDSDDTSKTWGA